MTNNTLTDNDNDYNNNDDLSIAQTAAQRIVNKFCEVDDRLELLEKKISQLEREK